MVAIATGWFIDHRRLTGATAPTPAVTTSAPVNRNPHNETVTGYNAKGTPTFTGPRGGVYHYIASGGKVYEKDKSKITPVAATID
jgi:hypothetical protein